MQISPKEKVVFLLLKYAVNNPDLVVQQLLKNFQRGKCDRKVTNLC